MSKYFSCPRRTHRQLAGSRGGFGDGPRGLGGLDLSYDNDVHGYFFGAHFCFRLVFVEVT